MLTLSPLANALAAGNRVIVKPSELAPATADVIHRMIQQCFANDHVAVVTGGSDLAAAFAALPFDHILFTGSTRVGTLVAQAAAANLTPVTLELGGKSPALVHESFSTAVAADRICSAKFWNAGQTCVAPDYVLVHEHQLEAFQAEAAKVAFRRHANPVSSADYAWMVNQAGYDRMQALLQDALDKGATVVPLVQNEETRPAGNRAFAPVIVVGVTDTMRVMQEEIFGPILPVLTYRTMEDAIKWVNDRPRPLALYYFDHDRRRIASVIDRTVSGGVTVNDCIYHLAQHDLPFGGIGPSGQGAYHGFDGFVTFSKKKGVLLQSDLTANIFGKLTKPPYTKWTDRMATLLIGKSVKHPSPVSRRVIKITAALLVVGAIGIASVWAPDRPVEELIPTLGPAPSQFMDVDGMKAHVRDEGPSDDSEPIVLLHGTSSSLHTWDGWVSQLKSQRRVIRVDLPGFGLTGPNPNGKYDIETYSHFVASLMSQLHVQHAVLVGNSLGGYVAWKTAVDYPSRITKLILIDAAGYKYESQSVPLGFRLARIPLLSPVISHILPKSIVANSVRNVYGDPSKVTPALIERYYETTLRAGNREAVVARFNQMKGGEFEREIKEVKQPTLIIWGGKDRLIPLEYAERFHHDIPGSTVMFFNGLGHVPQEEAPLETVKVAQEFLTMKPAAK